MAVVNNNVTVGTSATRLTPTDKVSGMSVAIKVPTGGGPVYIGSSTVTTDTGFPLDDGEGITLDTDEVLYAVAAEDQQVFVLAVEVQA